MPSLVNAVSIAAAAGIPIGELAGSSERSPPPPETTAAIIEMIGEAIVECPRVEGIEISGIPLVSAIAKTYPVIMTRMDTSADVDEARALIPWLQNRFQKELRRETPAASTS